MNMDTEVATSLTVEPAPDTDVVAEATVEVTPEDLGPKFSHTHLIQHMKYKPGFRPLQSSNVAGDFWFAYMGAAEFEWGEIPKNLRRIQAGVAERRIFTSSFLVTYEQVPVDRLRKGKHPHEFVGDPGPYRLYFLDTNGGTGLPVAQYIFQTHLNDQNATYGKRPCYLKEGLRIRGALGVGAKWERAGDMPDTWLAFAPASPEPDTIYTTEPFMVFLSEAAMLNVKRRLETETFVERIPGLTGWTANFQDQ